jgi:GT2 family glycosyltransferase
MLAMAAVSVVVLTMGDRPDELAAAISSARSQRDVEVEIVLVVNGANPDRSLADTIVEPGENLGIPGGRNAGAAAATHGLLCFLDDDGELVGDDLLARAGGAFSADRQLGAIGFRIIDEHGETARRHLPGLRARPERSGPATSFPGGGVIVRRAAFDGAGGLCAPFFYGLEETDLAWRLIDHGWTIRYDAELVMRHPRTDPSRHPSFFTHTARNRVWLAHRSLPAPLAAAYVANWTLVTCLRNWRDPAAIRAHFAGLFEGRRDRVGPRRPVGWRTVRTLTRLGRPPII